MSFWEEAFSNFADNARLVGAAALDTFDWAQEDGEARHTAAEVERQQAEREGREVDQARIDRSAKGGMDRIATAADKTAREAGAKVGGALDVVTNPWVVGAVVAVVALVALAPYVGPLLSAKAAA